MREVVWARRKATWPGRVLLVVAALAGSKSLSTAGPTDEACCSIAASCSDTLKELQNRNKELRARLSQRCWPGLKCFFSDGQIYSVPLRAVRRNDSHRPAKAGLAYLAGFFDGDGSVYSQPCLSGTSMKVAQSFDQAEVLMVFRETFGGSIGSETRGMGLRKPKLQAGIRPVGAKGS
ncbi:CES2 [Symbiodinium sp. CCMP2456]|nr:CES2 [Symbiodinium sp. CCMP2456]